MKAILLVMTVLLAVTPPVSAATTVDARCATGSNVPSQYYLEVLHTPENAKLTVDLVKLGCPGYDEIDIGLAYPMYSKEGWTGIAEISYASATGGQHYWIPTGLMIAEQPKWHGSLLVLHYLPANDVSVRQTWIYTEAFKRFKGFDLGISCDWNKIEGCKSITKIGLVVQAPIAQHTTGELRLARVTGGSFELRLRTIIAW